MPFHPGVRLEQEVGLAVDLHPATVEHDGLDAQRRRVLAFRRADVADVVHRRLDLRYAQRPRLRRLDIGRLAVDDPELIDLQRVHRLQRVLPAVLLHRRRISQLGLEVRLVDVDDRLDQPEVGHQRPVDQRAPLHAGGEPLDPHDGRIGIGVLDELNIVEIDGEADRVEVELPDVRRIALHPAVHLALRHAPERLLDEERDDDGEQHDDGHRNREPEPVASRPAAEPSEGIPHAFPTVTEQA